MDRLISRYDVYKVETISSVYMCVSGIPIRNGQRHVTEIARMSLDIINAAKRFHVASMPEVRLSLRIGAHTGMPATVLIHRSNMYAHITNVKAVKYPRIFTSIKTGYNDIIICYFSSYIFWNNKAQVILQTNYCLALSCKGKLS